MRHRALVLLFLAITVVMVAIYEAFGEKASLIAALISTGAELVTLVLAYLDSNKSGVDQWASDLAVQVSRAWSHRKDVLVSEIDELTTRFKRERGLEMAGIPAEPSSGDWQNVQEFFLDIPQQRVIILGEAGGENDDDPPARHQFAQETGRKRTRS